MPLSITANPYVSKPGSNLGAQAGMMAGGAVGKDLAGTLMKTLSSGGGGGGIDPNDFEKHAAYGASDGPDAGSGSLTADPGQTVGKAAGAGLGTAIAGPLGGIAGSIGGGLLGSGVDSLMGNKPETSYQIGIQSTPPQEAKRYSRVTGD